jgi:hypothetical protein
MNCLPVLLPRLCVACQENAGRGVAQEDGHRVVVGLGEELAWRRSDDVGAHAAPLKPTAGADHFDLRALITHTAQSPVILRGSMSLYYHLRYHLWAWIHGDSWGLDDVVPGQKARKQGQTGPNGGARERGTARYESEGREYE